MAAIDSIRSCIWGLKRVPKEDLGRILIELTEQQNRIGWPDTTMRSLIGIEHFLTLLYQKVEQEYDLGGQSITPIQVRNGQETITP